MRNSHAISVKISFTRRSPLIPPALLRRGDWGLFLNNIVITSNICSHIVFSLLRVGLFLQISYYAEPGSRPHRPAPDGPIPRKGGGASARATGARLQPSGGANSFVGNFLACRGATNETATEGLMCGGPLRAVRAEEGNPRPGLS